MTVSERDRNHAYNVLTEQIGPEVADTLMELLPHQPAGELVTRTDLFATATELRGEMAEIRGEMAELRAELKSDMAELRAELKSDMAELRAELKSDIAGLQRWGAAVVTANAVAVVTALVA